MKSYKPSIILDKSALQALSSAEITALHNHYLVQVPSILLYEIIGDLSKESKEKSGEVIVSQLARKFFTYSSETLLTISQYLTVSLVGQKQGQRLLKAYSGIKMYRTSEGKIAAIQAMSPEAEAIARWKQGEFDEAERLYAVYRRRRSRAIDLAPYANRILGEHPELTRISSIGECMNVLDRMIRTPSLAEKLFRDLFMAFPIDSEIAGLTLAVLRKNKKYSMMKISPFAAFCLRVLWGFVVCYRLDLVSTRKTNVLDLQYLIYASFAEVFVSGDKFHWSFAPYTLSKEQKLIKASDFKSDLARISQAVSSNEGLEKQGRGVPEAPPEMPGSITAQLWEKRRKEMPLTEKAHGLPPQAESEDLRRKTKAFEDAMIAYTNQIAEEGMKAPFDPALLDEEPEQIIRTSRISGLDRCSCGSGKPYSECCMAKRQERES